MDPETAKVWAPVVAALAGGLVAAASAYLVARANISGQRQTARDQAMREWRAEPVRALLKVVMRRGVLYQRLSTALARIAREQAEKHDELGREVERLVDELAATPDIAVYAAPILLDASDEMKRAMETLFEAENQAHAVLVGERMSLDIRATSVLLRILNAGNLLSESVGAIHHAAEAQVFDSQPRKKSLWDRILRRG